MTFNFPGATSLVVTCECGKQIVDFKIEQAGGAPNNIRFEIVDDSNLTFKCGCGRIVKIAGEQRT